MQVKWWDNVKYTCFSSEKRTMVCDIKIIRKMIDLRCPNGMFVQASNWEAREAGVKLPHKRQLNNLPWLPAKSKTIEIYTGFLITVELDILGCHYSVDETWTAWENLCRDVETGNTLYTCTLLCPCNHIMWRTHIPNCEENISPHLSTYEIYHSIIWQF